MFFPEKIVSIRNSDKVLEVGPGATPHERSNVLLERNYDSETEYIAQTGHVGHLKTNKKVVFYDGKTFPFDNNQFDYVICSHVIEHVADLNFFLNELQRVAPKGYIEFPTIYYEYLYNFPEHLNFCSFINNKIYWLPKSETNFNDFKQLHQFFYKSMQNYLTENFNDIFKNVFFQGFEWDSQIKYEKASTIENIFFDAEIYSGLINESVKRKNSIKYKLQRIKEIILS